MGVALAAGIAGAAGLASAGMGMASANDAKISPYKNTRDSAQGALAGYLGTAPLSYGLSSTYQPAYLGLGSQNLQQLLFGAPAQTMNQTIGWGPRNPDGSYRKSSTISQQMPGTTGLFDILGMAQPRLNQLQNQGVSDQLSTLNQFLPQAQDYMQQADPALMDLRRMLGLTSAQGLSMGSRWNPADLGRETNRIRGDWASRGLGTGQSAQMDEMLQILGGGEALRGQRQNYALGASQALQQTAPDYTNFILGLGQRPLNQAMGFVQQQQPLGYQGNTFDPYNPTAASLSTAGLAANSRAQADITNLWSGAAGGMLGLSGDFLGQYYNQKTPKP